MRKIFWLLPLVATLAWGAMNDCFVGNGTAEVTFGAGDLYVTDSAEFDGPVVLDAVAIIPDATTPDVSGGNIFTTGINTAPTAITDFTNEIPGATYTVYCGSIAGGFQSTIADGGNFTLDGAWTPATVGDNITLYCVAANTFREVGRAYAVPGLRLGYPFAATGAVPGTPEYTFIGDLDTGIDYNAANTFDLVTGGAARITVSATGLEGLGGAGFNGPVGAVGPSGGTFTNLAATGSFTFGQDPGELHTGYKDRSDYITFSDTFDVCSDADLAVRWNVATVVGLGTNTESGRPGWNHLVTGAAGAGDMESTISNGLNHYRAYAPRIECVVDLTDLVTQHFHFGFWAAGNEFVEIIYDSSVGPNWLLRVDDVGGPETINSGVVVTVNPTKLEITVDAAGNVNWAIDDIEMGVVGLTNQMTAAAHYVRWAEYTLGAVAHTADVDYFQSEQLKQQ